MFHPNLVICQDDNFMVFSRKVLHLTNMNSAAQRNQLQSVVPISVAFNEYHKKFIVVTRQDVRLYNSESGKLDEIFVDLLDGGKTIRSFDQGARSRMFYIGDSSGNVSLFNTKNAEKLKVVTDMEKDQEIIDRFTTIMHVREDPTPFKDVTAVLYLPDEKILVVGTVNSCIKLYNEIDSEESEFSRVFIGGHKDSEITHLAYWKESQQLASASENGIVCVWNIGYGKLDHILYDIPNPIVGMCFCQPYPLLLTAQKCGIITVWGLKNAGNEHSGKVVMRLLNMDDQITGGLSTKSSLVGIESCLISHSTERVYKKTFIADCNHYNTEDCIKYCREIIMEHRKDTEAVRIFNDFDAPQLNYMLGVVSKVDEATELIALMVSREMTPRNAVVKENNEYLYMIVGSSRGDIIITDLLPFIKSQNIFPFVSSPHSNTAPGAASKDSEKAPPASTSRESITAHSMLTLHLRHLPTKPFYKNVYPLSQSITLQYHSMMHNGPISTLSLIPSSGHSLVTSSTDQTIRLWDGQMRPIGLIELSGKNNRDDCHCVSWGFKYEWDKVRIQNMLKILEIEAKIEGVENETRSEQELLKIARERVYMELAAVDKLQRKKNRHIGEVVTPRIKKVKVQVQDTNSILASSIDSTKKSEKKKQERPSKLIISPEKTFSRAMATLSSLSPKISQPSMMTSIVMDSSPKKLFKSLATISNPSLNFLESGNDIQGLELKTLSLRKTELHSEPIKLGIPLTLSTIRKSKDLPLHLQLSNSKLKSHTLLKPFKEGPSFQDRPQQDKQILPGNLRLAEKLNQKFEEFAMSRGLCSTTRHLNFDPGLFYTAEKERSVAGLFYTAEKERSVAGLADESSYHGKRGRYHYRLSTSTGKAAKVARGTLRDLSDATHRNASEVGKEDKFITPVKPLADMSSFYQKLRQSYQRLDVGYLTGSKNKLRSKIIRNEE